MNQMEGSCYASGLPITPPQFPRHTHSTEGDDNMNKAFRVLFDTQGGSFVPPATDLSYGDRVAKPADPEKSTLSFAGCIGSTTTTHEPSVPQTHAPSVTTAPPVSSPQTTIQRTVDATITPPADTSDDDKTVSSAIYMLLLLLFMILLLRQTVTFLVTTADGIKK